LILIRSRRDGCDATPYPSSFGERPGSGSIDHNRNLRVNRMNPGCFGYAPAAFPIIVVKFSSARRFHTPALFG
jgi:hypothetical protein